MFKVPLVLCLLAVVTISLVWKIDATTGHNSILKVNVYTLILKSIATLIKSGYYSKCGVQTSKYGLQMLVNNSYIIKMAEPSIV